MQYLFHLPSYVWHGVCLSVFFFIGIMFGIALGLSVCSFGEICLALGLSVCWVNYFGHWVYLLVGLIMLGIGFVCLLVG